MFSGTSDRVSKSSQAGPGKSLDNPTPLHAGEEEVVHEVNWVENGACPGEEYEVIGDARLALCEGFQ